MNVSIILLELPSYMNRIISSYLATIYLPDVLKMCYVSYVHRIMFPNYDNKCYWLACIISPFLQHSKSEFQQILETCDINILCSYLLRYAQCYGRNYEDMIILINMKEYNAIQISNLSHKKKYYAIAHRSTQRN